MKTRNILVACAIGVCMFATVAASAQEEPAIRVYQSGKLLKVVFGYDSKVPVIVEFLDQNGTFSTDKVDEAAFSKGFIRRYNIKRDQDDNFWINVKNDMVSARFKISTAKGKLTSDLESVTYNHPIAQR